MVKRKVAETELDAPDQTSSAEAPAPTSAENAPKAKIHKPRWERREVNGTIIKIRPQKEPGTDAEPMPQPGIMRLLCLLMVARTRSDPAQQKKFEEEQEEEEEGPASTVTY